MTLALDLDGTLISCKPKQSAVLRAALVACGEAVDVDAVWDQKRDGASTKRALQICGLTLDAASAVSTYWQTRIEDCYWLGLDSVLGGVIETLGAWRARGDKLMLVTARSRPEWIGVQLRHLGLAAFFTRVEFVDPASAAEAKAAVLRASGVSTFIGDTESDARAAQAAGVRFIGVASGQRSAEFLRHSGVLTLAATLAEIRV